MIGRHGGVFGGHPGKVSHGVNLVNLVNVSHRISVRSYFPLAGVL